MENWIRHSPLIPTKFYALSLLRPRSVKILAGKLEIGLIPVQGLRWLTRTDQLIQPSWACSNIRLDVRVDQVFELL